ncbi:MULTISPECIES: hypothetical protein [Paenibacillus]|uniref:hypothetical protein n=1 Tax=Paenibacillus TaxID=44249 RepID=UPI0030DA7D8F
MKKLLISLLIMSTLFSGSAMAASNTTTSNIKITSTTEQKASNKVKSSIFNLSDQQLKNAIAIGKKGYDAVIDFNNKQKLKISIDKLEIWQPDVWVSSPYYNIVRASFLKFNDYDTYTLKDAKEFLALYKGLNRLDFELRTYGNSITFTKNLKVVLKQGSKVYQPKDIRGKDNVSMSGSWPEAPAYVSVLHVSFDNSKIDFSKPAELVYMYSGKELSVTYKVDFTKVK